MTTKAQPEKKKSNPFLMFLFAIVIPLIIVIVILLVIFNIAGFNVGEWTREKASEIPVLSNVITSPEEIEMEDELSHLSTELGMKNEEIELLDMQVRDLEITVADLEQEISRQEEIIARYESNEMIQSDAEAEEEASLKDIAKTFEEMKPAGAASIMTNMSENEVVNILNVLPTDVRGEILEAMEAETAATLTLRLMEQ